MQEQLNLGIRKKNGRNWKRRIVPNLAETIETALRLTKRGVMKFYISCSSTKGHNFIMLTSR